MVPLESSHLFSQLPPADLQQLRSITRELAFPAHGEIFKEGDPGDGVYVVKSGQVAISAVVGTGERRVFSTLGPGDFFGEMAVLDQQPRSACATAETAVTFSTETCDKIGCLAMPATISSTVITSSGRTTP